MCAGFLNVICTNVVHENDNFTTQVNVADNQGLTPLFKASRNGHANAVKMLLDYGANGEAISQSTTRLRDLHSHGGAMRQLREPTPDGADWVFSKVLNRRYRHL